LQFKVKKKIADIFKYSNAKDKKDWLLFIYGYDKTRMAEWHMYAISLQKTFHQVKKKNTHTYN